MNTNLTRRTALLGTAAAGLAVPRLGRADTPVIKIGVMNDQSGPYRDSTGQGSVICTKQAVEEWGDSNGFKVEVLSADHQNKADVGATIVRQWIDRDGVDVIVDVPTSSVALAVATIIKEKNKVFMNAGAGSADLTGAQCTPNTVHWSYDTYMLARSTATQLVKLGGDKWYFITADYVFGHQLERDAAAFVKKAGGQVLGATRYPFPSTTDFSSYLLAAQASGANVIGFANAGGDTVNGVKQAYEFGVTKKMRLASLLIQAADIGAMGLNIAQGLYMTSSFYWDMNDHTRAFTKRVIDKLPHGEPPNMIQAGSYAGTLHYLKAVKALGVAKAKEDGAAVVAQMKAMPTEDDAFGKGRIREDGRGMFPAYLFQVKTPAESKAKNDVLKLVATTPADEAWRPLSEGGCSLVRS